MVDIVQGLPHPAATAAAAEALRYEGPYRLTAMRRHDLARYLQSQGLEVGTDETKEMLLVKAAAAGVGMTQAATQIPQVSKREAELEKRLAAMEAKLTAMSAPAPQAAEVVTKQASLEDMKLTSLRALVKKEGLSQTIRDNKESLVAKLKEHYGEDAA